jgi:ppGpp synthetase/RelA/SpoT-type nucleotidyltranferase
MSVSIQRDVERFFANTANVAAYHTLLNDMLAFCEGLKRRLGPTVVRTIYSRKDKQDGEALKAFPKIAKALAAKRASDPSAPVSVVEDIIGLTVVTYYPDQIETLVQEVQAHEGLSVTVEKDKPVTQNGYHAHHIVVQSNDPVHADLRCEVQVKTMMHDSWAAKMHDLNYKPQGYTDKRLSTIMGVFGDALQSIEKQSELLRNLIHERWNAEVGRRRGARRALFSQLPVIRSRKAFSGEANRIYQVMHDTSRLNVTTEPKWRELAASIVGHGRKFAREGAWLALCLAAVADRPEHLAVVIQRVNRVLADANNLLKTGEVDGQEIWCLPLALSACGALDGAIEASDYILTHVTLPAEDRTMVQFNLANFLVEEAIFDPLLPGAAERRARIEALMTDCAHIEAGDPSAFCDLRGMLEVALSSDVAVVRKALDQIQLGLTTAAPEDHEIAHIYFELHSRLAWRRLLELEAETAADPLPPALPS